MTMTTDKKNAGGRPPRYSLDQVHTAITRLINDGTPRDEIDAAGVKAVLCEQHGITKGIDTRSLEAPVAHVLASIAEEEEDRLIAAMPDTVGASVESVVGAMTRELQLLVARQNAVCLAQAQEECEVLRRDKVNANWRIKELEREGEDKAREIAEMTDLSERKIAENKALTEEVTTLRAELDRMQKAENPIDRIVLELKKPGARDEIKSMISEIMSRDVDFQEASVPASE
jgi:regulator of replication initiation timing